VTLNERKLYFIDKYGRREVPLSHKLIKCQSSVCERIRTKKCKRWHHLPPLVSSGTPCSLAATSETVCLLVWLWNNLYQSTRSWTVHNGLFGVLFLGQKVTRLSFVRLWNHATCLPPSFKIIPNPIIPCW
jgi:hypothetical protein